MFQRTNIRNKKKRTELGIKQQKTEFELKENELENKKKRELLSSKLQQRMEMTVRFNKLQQSFYEPEKQTGFIESMTNQVILTKAEWKNYIKEANSVFDNKIDYLREKHKELTDTDLIVVVLIGMGIDISDSCVLLKMSKETMYIRRKRVKKRLGIDVDLEEWIKQNIV
jgi:phenylalanyl-tRNA synthetase alpha subunit